jgi:chromate transporter
MTAVTLQLGRAALVDRPTIALAAASALLLIRWKISPGWLLAAGAATEAALVGHG